MTDPKADANPPPPNANTLWARVFVEELARGGLTHACVSPGSRSTPLTLALAAHPRITVSIHVDERSGAFFGLGYAKITGNPVALVCTSGSAPLNFAPALAEARHSGTPLLVLTADRPPELRGMGANQTTDQIKMYGDIPKWFFEVGTPHPAPASLRRLRLLAAQALHTAVRYPAGPVHLNFPFRKPLEPVQLPPDSPDGVGWLERQVEAGDSLVHGAWTGLEDNRPYGLGCPSLPVPDPRITALVATMADQTPEGVIVCGPLNIPVGGVAAGDLANAVVDLARRLGWPVVAEPPSGLRQGPHNQTPNPVLAQGQAVLRNPGFRKRAAPRMVLRLGGALSQSPLDDWLEDHPDCPVVAVNPGGEWLSPSHHPVWVVQSDEAAFCRALAQALSPTPAAPEPPASWLALWQLADRAAQSAVDQVLDGPAPQGLRDNWFEGRVFKEISSVLARRKEEVVQVTANSMPVRDLDGFTPKGTARVRHLVNRGLSGIDGMVSTACGAACATGKPTLLVTGDLSCYHDSNGLLAAKKLRLPLLVVVVNNDGGGIFDMLPVAQTGGAAFEECFGTPHGLDFQSLAGAYGMACHRPQSWGAFSQMLEEALNTGGPSIIEIRTDRKTNKEMHQRVWQAVNQKIDKAL
ncbi:MAG: 2-succinyl-5-enolpyruvyl-6-hydroxy-3-cyclohexene-1-carboxylic-acid synthase [Deltaproteobacteria bacterium]|nr:2-succinyl-5-enolpyruvyl-6-hydroxy-3-cyclohexene-1-carboxylic-acid synthase [Deltaproteobacteria bacterium]